MVLYLKIKSSRLNEGILLSCSTLWTVAGRGQPGRRTYK